jgi:D-alanyl-D-alanine carboxypeptidase
VPHRSLLVSPPSRPLPVRAMLVASAMTSPRCPMDQPVEGPMSDSAADGARWAAALDGVVAETAAGRLLPGVQRCLLRVETPHRPEGWTAAGTGHRDDRGGLDPEVAFRIASVTKMMTSTALLALADQGRCRLDDPTGQYLPGEVVDRFHDRTGRAYSAAVTLRQLLDHTSGLPNFFSQPPILDAVQHGGGRRRFTPADLVELAVAGEPPTSPPGTARAYTDTGFLLAGLIIEALMGRPLQAAYRELVLDPAGMADTWLESSDEPPRRHAIASHDFEGQDITDMDPTVDWAGGGLVSTAADLAAFLRALTRGQLVSADAWREMTRWQPGPQGFYDDYGLGLGRYRFPAAQVIGHHGVWGAFAFWSPELDAVITGTINTGRVDRRPLLEAVVRALLPPAAARGNRR